MSPPLWDGCYPFGGYSRTFIGALFAGRADLLQIKRAGDREGSLRGGGTPLALGEGFPLPSGNIL